MNLRLQKCSRRDVIDLVSRSEADLGILFSMKSAIPRLKQAARIKDVELTPLGESSLHAVMRAGHPMIRGGDLTDMGRYPYVIIENDEDYSRLYDDASGSTSDLFATPPSTIISTNDSMTCQSIVAHSDAFFISTTPWKHGPHYDFASIPLPGKENQITFFSVLHCGQLLSPLGQAYMDQLQKLMKEL